MSAEFHLRCEVKQERFRGSDRKPFFSKDGVAVDAVLKDGAFMLGENPDPAGKGCRLVDGDTVCVWHHTAPPYISGAGPITQRRHSEVRFNRATGEIHTTLDLWDYVGERAEGVPTGHVTVVQSGLCRQQ